jgi:hypothetical protein
MQSQSQSFRRLAAACAVACAAGAAFGAEPAAADANATTQEPFLIAEDTWIYMIDEPGIYLDRARADVGRKRPQRAAADVRKAAAVLDHEASRVDDDDWARLERDARTLLTIAGLIDAGALTDVAQYDRALSLVRADLGAHCAARASESWAQRDLYAAGRSLSAAARYVKTALATADDSAGTGLRERLTAVDSYGQALARRGATATVSDWQRSRAAVGQALETLGKKIEPATMP